VGYATVRAAFRLLRTILNKAVMANLIGRNPTAGLRAPGGPTREMHFASAEEVAKLAGAVPERYEALIYLLAYGLRIGEAAALQVADLDLLRGRVTHQQGRCGDPGAPGDRADQDRGDEGSQSAPVPPSSPRRSHRGRVHRG